MKGYEQSGLTRREYCQQRGIPLTTFDYYRHRRDKKLKKKQQPPALVAVKLLANLPAPGAAATLPMTLVLTNGRRVEVAPDFVETDLARLLRVAERV